MGELPHQVVFRALGAVGAVVVRGGTVARNDSAVVQGLDLLDRRGTRWQVPTSRHKRAAAANWIAGMRCRTLFDMRR